MNPSNTNKDSHTRKTVLVIGASGGLGSAIARAFAARGADLALSAHRRQTGTSDLPVTAKVSTHLADLTNPASLITLRDNALTAHEHIDVVVNAAGYDARQSLGALSLEDIYRSVDINLLGAIIVTQAFLPVMPNGVIVHLGGFADGRLAFPFYSIDVASRAGLRSYCESVNRELALAHSPGVDSFFSASPADTEAERPFHPIWKQMGIKILSPERVTEELVGAVARREKVHVMGGFLTRFFAVLNAASPNLADALVMNRYSSILQKYFRGEE